MSSTHSFVDDSTLHTARQIRNERGRNVDNINMDLATILKWGSNNLVDFNANKTQACLFSRKADLTFDARKLKRDSAPYESDISDTDRLLIQKDEEIRRMHEMLKQMQEKLKIEAQDNNKKHESIIDV
ncbi:unnamed protein product [Phaedon cochleariae]|uniref:Uncharacterized protein n=1 Tax=Phaedon cochleariae TaxID=80249 RepID=A0A9N9SB27_PHACE|nr:unnamed protein product [Phaedon cochleariae]